MKAVLLAFDPGITTGSALITYEPHDPMNVRDIRQLPTFEAFYAVLESLAGVDIPTTVVCEDFILRRGVAMTSDQTSPLYLIGALQYVAYQNRNIKLVMQTPAAAKQVTDEHLQKLGIFQTPKTKWDHANDALRHAVLYLKNQRHMPTLEKGFK